MSIRRYRLLCAIVVMIGLLAACGQPTANDDSFGAVANTPHEHSGEAGDNHQDQTAQAATTTLQPVLATSEVVVGPNRLAIGLLEKNVPIADAAQTRVHVRYYKLNGQQATLAGEEDARYYGEGLGPRGTFIVHPSFDSAGAWGMEVEAQRPNQPVTTHRMQLDVAEQGSAPTIGSDAPRSKTPTAADVQDLKTITSSTEPDPRLYQTSIDQAVTSGKPSLILFATPGFCQTAVCGPGVDVLGKLVDTFGDKIVPVHVEIYQYPFEKLQQVPAMQEWGLKTEPWLFLVDKNGKVAGRYEGGITFEELQPDVEKLLAQ
ncbi:MAG TPA: hypothetical protein VFZ66_27035 [Herpetosiphonaceae bacterium]